MTRIYVDLPLASGQDCELPAVAAHHVRDVLRLTKDAELVLFDGRGGEYHARLCSVGRAGVRAEVGARHEPSRESPLAVTLVQSISRGERMDYTLQKAVELGVRDIVPVVSVRTVVKLDAAREAKRLEHWRGIVRHAAEQSGRTHLPSIAPVVPLGAWLAERGALTAYLLDPQASHRLATEPAPDNGVAILAGPEGGFDPDERQRMLDLGVVPVRLGPRILRTETAALCALAVMQARWGDV